MDQGSDGVVVATARLGCGCDQAGWAQEEERDTAGKTTLGSGAVQYQILKRNAKMLSQRLSG